MNLISIEEHLFFTWAKTNDDKYLDCLDGIRKIRIELLKKIIKNYRGEIWCVSKHLLASSMRLMKTGTKYLKEGNREEAKTMFMRSYEVFNLFLSLVLDNKNNSQTLKPPAMTKKTEKEESILNKLSQFIKSAVDCCKE